MTDHDYNAEYEQLISQAKTGKQKQAIQRAYIAGAQSLLIDEAGLKEVTVLLDQIAYTANYAERLCYQITAEATQVTLVGDLSCALGAAISQVGWMADLGYGKASGTGPTVKGDAEEWLLPPSYHSAREKEEAA